MKLLCVFLACAVGVVYCGFEPRVVAYGAHITHPWWGKSSVWRTQIHPNAYEVHDGYDSYHGDHDHDHEHGYHPEEYEDHHHYGGEHEEPYGYQDRHDY